MTDKIEVEASKDERNWAVILHLSPLAGYFIPLLGFILPLLIWLLKKDESPYLNQQGKEVINFLITLVIAVTVAALLTIIVIGLLLLLILWVYAIVATIVAAVQTSKGANFRYPYILRLIS